MVRASDWPPAGPASLDPPGLGFPGCGWLQICVNPARIFTLLPRQVLDLVDWQGGQKEFETRHSPHTPGRPIFTVITLIC
jgi:hypothetical protein